MLSKEGDLPRSCGWQKQEIKKKKDRCENDQKKKKKKKEANGVKARSVAVQFLICTASVAQPLLM